MGGDPDLQRFNIRGTLIVTSKAKFRTFPNTKLGKLTTASPEYNPQHDEFFIDRNPMMFHFILDLYNTGELHIPKTLCAGSIRKELEFWEIHENLLRPCCWKTLYSDDDDCEAYSMISKVDCTVSPKPVPNTQQMNSWNQEREIRHRIWNILNKPASSITGKIWFTLVFLSVTVSIVVFGLSTTAILRSSIVHSHNTSAIDGGIKLYTTTTLHDGMIWTDFATNLILFLDFFLRFYSCLKRKEFMCNILNYIDLLVYILIFHITYSEMNPKINHQEIVNGQIVFRYVYALRALRLFRLLMHTRGMKIIKLCIKVNFVEFLFFIALFLSFACIFAAVMYFAELDYANGFSDFFESVWWAVITISSVGYGDKVPESIIGHAIGIMAAFSGILIVTIPIVVISTNYGSYYNCYKMIDKHRKTNL